MSALPHPSSGLGSVGKHRYLTWIRGAYKGSYSRMQRCRLPILGCKATAAPCFVGTRRRQCKSVADSVPSSLDSTNNLGRHFGDCRHPWNRLYFGQLGKKPLPIGPMQMSSSAFCRLPRYCKRHKHFIDDACPCFRLSSLRPLAHHPLVLACARPRAIPPTCGHLGTRLRHNEFAQTNAAPPVPIPVSLPPRLAA